MFKKHLLLSIHHQMTLMYSESLRFKREVSY